MKTIRDIIFIFLSVILAISCTQEDEINIGPASDGIYNLRLVVPTAKKVLTRADVTEGTLENVYVLVFDHNGGFLTRSKAEPAGADPGSYQVELNRTPDDLPTERKKRIIHIIANYDWSDFSDVRNLGKHENDLIMNLSVTNNKYVYWYRTELPNGVDEEALSSSIELICSAAQISVLNNSDDLTEMSYAIGDYIPYGTVAPFNSYTLEFDKNSVIQSSEGEITAVQESDFINADGGDTPTNSIICYERTNSIAVFPTFVIVKGKFSGETCYYKIDIILPGKGTLEDIQRNHHYILNVKDASEKGSSTLEEAAAGPAANNLTYSIVLEKYTSIAGGNSSLNVETTEKTFVRTGQEFKIGYSYYPDIAGEQNSSLVHVDIVHEDDDKPVVSSFDYNISQSTNYSYIVGTTANILPEFGYYKGKFILTAEYDGITLSRTINLRLRMPSIFGNPHINPSPVPLASGRTVELNFSIPSSIHESNFPMEIFISTKILSPDIQFYDDELVLDYQIPGRYRYKYIAHQWGDHTIHFRTNLDRSSKDTAEDLILESDLFTTVTIPQ